MVVEPFIFYFLPYVIPSQSSVLNGDAGKSALLYKLQIGLAAHAYLTATGFLILEFQTTISSPAIFVSAQTNFLSSPAIANPLNFALSGVFNPNNS